MAHDNDAIVAAIEARLQAERDAKKSADLEGDRKLDELWKQLQAYQGRYGVNIHMHEQLSFPEKEVCISRTGQELARWYRSGRSLFLRLPNNKFREAYDVSEAFAITIELLARDHLPVEPLPIVGTGLGISDNAPVRH